MGLNEGINVFVDESGKLLVDNAYVPAYVRRYPFMLARLRQDSDELSLCFARESGLVGAFDEGNALFEDGTPSETPRPATRRAGKERARTGNNMCWPDH